MRHGMPDQDRQWSLEGVARKASADDGERVQRMRTCMSCYAMNPVWRTDCEQCHAPFEATREQPKQTEGELVEITEAQKEQMRRDTRLAVNAARTREELEAVAKAKGYKPGWVFMKMQARQRRSA